MVTTDRCPGCHAAESQSVVYSRRFPQVDGAYEDQPDYVARRLWIAAEVLYRGQGLPVFSVHHCGLCDFVYLSPRPEPADVAAKYDFLIGRHSTEEEYEKVRRKYVAERAERIARCLDTHGVLDNAKRVADVGGQYGSNLSALPVTLERWVVDFEDLVSGGDIHWCHPDSEEARGPWDVILLNHVLEHLSEPLDYLQTLRESLSPSGAVLIEVPLGVFREAWDVREPTTHCNFFSERALVEGVRRAGLFPQMYEVAFQWTTHHAEWCINVLARRDDFLEVERRGLVNSRLRSASDERHNFRRYVPLVAKRIVGSRRVTKW